MGRDGRRALHDLVIVAFWYFYPIWTYVRIPYRSLGRAHLVPRLVLAGPARGHLS